jgi:predicted ATPase
MINKFSLTNFKCYQHLDLPLGALTLLTGLNAAGKSSAVQGALLISQALRSNGNSRCIPLNGPLVRLGTAGEIANQEPRDLASDQHDADRSLSFGFESSAASIEWRLNPSDDGVHTTMQIAKVIAGDAEGIREISVDKVASLDRLLPTSLANHSCVTMVSALRELSFLAATRASSRELFPSPDVGEMARGDVGTNGEYAPWWLSRLSEDDVAEARRAPAEKAPTLRRQINAWGAELFPGFEANATLLEKTGLVQLQLRTHITHDWRKPANVGFGLSYAFPLLVAGLTAQGGQILIVDSPEAHLHPRGQSRIGRFLGVVAASGVQVLVETHSDHVLNGIRVAVKDELISSNDVTIHFLTKGDDGLGGDTGARPSGAPKSLYTATLDARGRLSDWPAGFFDQIENDLAQL